MPVLRTRSSLVLFVGLTILLMMSLTQISHAQNQAIQLTHTGQNLGMARTDGVFLGDIDGDGDQDILTQDNQYSPSQIWLNNGSGMMSNGGRIGEQYEMLPLFGDVDGDGDLDAVSRVVRLNNGGGNFTIVRTNDNDFWPLTSDREYRKLGDIDGDTDLDYVSTQAVWTNNGSGVFTRGMTLNAPLRPLELADIDRDSDLDVIVLDTPNFGLRIWRNNGQGVFTADQPQPLSSLNYNRFTLGDIDNDGDPDLVAGGFFTGVMVFLNNGSGNFNQSIRRVEVGIIAYDIALGDLDGDRDLDVFVARGGQGDVVFRNNGSSFEQAWLSPFIDNSWVVALGDLNNDGRLDAVTGNMGELSATSNGAPDRIFLNTTPQNRPQIIAQTTPRQSGSTIVAQALFLPPNAAVSISINGISVLSQAVTTDATGSLSLLIRTTGASDGFYTLELQAQGLAQPLRLSFVLRSSSPLIIEQAAGATVLDVPANSGLPINHAYLPRVR